MAEIVGGILKKSRIKMVRPRCVGDVSGADRPQARIVERGETGVVIEVTCSCGKKLTLQCDYAPVAGQTPPAGDQAGVE